METREILDILIAVVALGFIVSYNGIMDLTGLVSSFPTNTAIIGLSFLLHELAHRQMARRLGFFARFELWSTGVLLSIFLSIVLGVKLAAVGSVMIYPIADLWGRAKLMTRKDMMLIAVVGPATNVIISMVSVAGYLIYPLRLWLDMIYLNLWLALFNLFPLPPLDGSRIFFYNWKLWMAIFLAVFLGFSYISYVL